MLYNMENYNFIISNEVGKRAKNEKGIKTQKSGKKIHRRNPFFQNPDIC